MEAASAQIKNRKSSIVKRCVRNEVFVFNDYSSKAVILVGGCVRIINWGQC